MARTFRASYPGSCADCGERIRVDDVCRYSDGQVIHDDCRDHEPPPERPVAICDRCWLAKPCGCDD